MKEAGIPFEAIHQVTPTIEDLFVDAVTTGAEEVHRAQR